MKGVQKMKQVVKANASGEVFYIERQTEESVTLRNPMTGNVKEVKVSTLKRSYNILSEEEIKMAVKEQGVQETAATIEQVNAIAFTELLGCDSKAEFEEALAEVVIVEGHEDIEVADDYDFVKKAKGNAALCFKENMDRFKKAKGEYEASEAAKDANPTDLDVVKSNEVAKAALQKYANKMALYLGKVKVANDKLVELKPAPAEPTDPETTPAE